MWKQVPKTTVYTVQNNGHKKLKLNILAMKLFGLNNSISNGQTTISFAFLITKEPYI